MSGQDPMTRWPAVLIVPRCHCTLCLSELSWDGKIFRDNIVELVCVHEGCSRQNHPLHVVVHAARAVPAPALDGGRKPA